MNLYKLFTDLDCLQLEINPWAETMNEKLVCIDGYLILKLILYKFKFNFEIIFKFRFYKIV